ncbi:MAG TPA: SDR family NAD(P)-dependent oxidoreductase [Aeromicrobium sp.]|nr:SDR family NAD(P)-dependent oxidoreductase [Aeromicrobium sp.]
MKDLKGRTALLTGASGGIGRKIAEALADAGANVVVSGRRKDALADAAQAVTQRGAKAAVIPADLSDFDAIDPLVEAAEAALGPIDILVNNAGVELAAPFTAFTRDELTSLIDVNVTSPMLLTHRVLPGMVERGSGTIVFIASAAGHLPPAYAAHYAASKAALIALTKSLRAEYTDSPVGFSVVSPGFVAGDGMFQRILDSGVKAPKLLGMTSTEKVADAVVRAIKRDSVEVLITGSPARPVDALGALAPKTHERIVNALGMHSAFGQVARMRGRL